MVRRGSKTTVQVYGSSQSGANTMAANWAVRYVTHLVMGTHAQTGDVFSISVPFIRKKSQASVAFLKDRKINNDALKVSE